MIVETLRGVDTFAPKCATNAEQVLTHKGAVLSPRRIEAVSLLKRGDGHSPVHLRHIAALLRIIEIAVFARTEHDLSFVAHGCIDGRLCQTMTPSIDNAAGLYGPEFFFIPIHRRLLQRLEAVDDAIEKILLQLPVFRVAFFTLELLTSGAIAPCAQRWLTSFVASQMDIRSWKYIGQLRKDIVEKFINKGFGGAEQFVAHATRQANGYGLLCTRQLRETMDGSHLMSR